MGRDFLVLSVICVSFLIVSVSLSKTESLTFDETFYLSCALQTVHDRQLDPRLVDAGVAPVPWMITYLPPLWSSGGEDRPKAWQGEMNDPVWIRWPRFLNAAVFGIPLLCMCFFWLRRRCGSLAAFAGTAALACSPLIVGHASLATMDLGFTCLCLVSFLTIGWTLQRPNFKRIAVSAVVVALCLSSKYSGIFLIPTMLILLAIRGHGEPGFDKWKEWAHWRFVAAGSILWLSILLPAWWGFHTFATHGPLKQVPLAETPDESPWVRVLGRNPIGNWIMDQAHEHWHRPAPMTGVLFQMNHNQEGHPAFLLGQTSQHGWWYYFPCVFAFKSTPVELILSLVVVIGILLAMFRGSSGWSQSDPAIKAMLTGSLIFAILLLTSRINLGQRYLMPLYPLLVMVGVSVLCGLLSSQRQWLRFLLILLVLGQMSSLAMAYPRVLGYFNFLCGGPAAGPRLLADSNLDWGQDLPALKQRLQQLQARRTLIGYFGTALPAAYGIEGELVQKRTRPIEEYDFFALSITALRLSSETSGCFHRFNNLIPDGTAGSSFLIFRLDSPERRRLVEQAGACEKARIEAHELKYGKPVRDPDSAPAD